jgi:hypothetical protein
MRVYALSEPVVLLENKILRFCRLFIYYPGHSKWAFREGFVRLKNVLERSNNNPKSLFFFCYVPWTF